MSQPQSTPRILLSFTGFHDPYAPSPIDGTQQPGPIIAMLGSRPYDRIILFNTPGAARQTEATVEAISRNWPSLQIMTKDLPDLIDPTNHSLILQYLRKYTREILNQFPNAELSISLSSGTPSMHACWLLLVAEGSLPAHILYGHPLRSPDETYRVTEVNLTASEFPEIAPRIMHLQPGTDDYLAALPAMCEALGIVGSEKCFTDALDRAARLAPYDCHVLVLGETGTGKEHIARLIHQMSGRRNGSFVPVNCAAMPKELAESILFGHEKGAFTGAAQKQDGDFLRAHGGTLFLDEIGEMPLAIQSKLLRVLQDGIIRPLGGKDRQVDVRVVAATNQDLARAIRDGKFRTDLIQRFLDTIELPPLRKRRGDIARFATYTINRWNRKHNTRCRIGRDALTALQVYKWPGNVRELIAAVERAAITTRADTIKAQDLRLGEAAWQADEADSILPEPYEGFSLRDYLQNARQTLIRKAITQSNGNNAAAARLLGISPQALHKHLQPSNATGT